MTSDDFELISGLVRAKLGFECSVLMGVSVVNEMLERFSGASVGFDPGAESTGAQWLFHITAVPESVREKLSSTLKSVHARPLVWKCNGWLNTA